MTAAQKRLVDLIRRPTAKRRVLADSERLGEGPPARRKHWRFENITRTVDALIRARAVRLDENGYLFTADYVDGGA
jgi:hypothetical protein